MRSLPRAITGLVLYLLVIFNIERITLQDDALVDIKGFVYVLIALFIIAIIQYERVRSQSVWTLYFIATTIYFFGKFSVFFEVLPRHVVVFYHDHFVFAVTVGIGYQKAHGVIYKISNLRFALFFTKGVQGAAAIALAASPHFFAVGIDNLDAIVLAVSGGSFLLIV